MFSSFVQHLFEGWRIKRKVITFQIETDIIGDPHDDMLVGLLIYVVIEDTFAISYDISAERCQSHKGLKGELFGWTCMLGAVGTS